MGQVGAIPRTPCELRYSDRRLCKIRIMQFAREGSLPSGLRLLQAKLSRRNAQELRWSARASRSLTVPTHF